MYIHPNFVLGITGQNEVLEFAFFKLVVESHHNLKSTACFGVIDNNMFASLTNAIAPGFYCRNDSEIPILFVMSQLSPLHWNKVEPGNEFRQSKQIFRCTNQTSIFFTRIYSRGNHAYEVWTRFLHHQC